MEIREWLDDSGKQTSVDVTDLGKVRLRQLVDSVRVLLPTLSPLRSLGAASSLKITLDTFVS